MNKTKNAVVFDLYCSDNIFDISSSKQITKLYLIFIIFDL